MGIPAHEEILKHHLRGLGLPDIDGVGIIRTIRQWPAVPIILICARSEDTDKIKASDAGADGYLTKAFSAEELSVGPATRHPAASRLKRKGVA